MITSTIFKDSLGDEVVLSHSKEEDEPTLIIDTPQIYTYLTEDDLIDYIAALKYMMQLAIDAKEEG